MASRVLNPRFDHWCRIYRRVGGDEFTRGEEVVLYEGRCYIYEANNLRQYLQGGAMKEDMGCDVPGLLDTVRQGDLIDFNRYGDTATACTIGSPIPSKMGSTFRFNRPKI